MIGSGSIPFTSLGVVCSIVGALRASSLKLASVTEEQANERDAIARRVKRDLNDFIICTY